jgi:hypothetical protein
MAQATKAITQENTGKVAESFFQGRVKPLPNLEKIAKWRERKGGSSEVIITLDRMEHKAEIKRLVTDAIRHFQEMEKRNSNGNFHEKNVVPTLEYVDLLLQANHRLTQFEKTFAQAFMIYYASFPPGVREGLKQTLQFFEDQPNGRVMMKVGGKQTDVGTFVVVIGTKELMKGDPSTAIALGLGSGQYMPASSAFFWGYFVVDPRYRNLGFDAIQLYETIKGANAEAEKRGKKLEWVFGEAEIPIKRAVIDQLPEILELHKKYNFIITGELPAKTRARIDMALKESLRVKGVDADDIQNAMQALVSEEVKLTDRKGNFRLNEIREALEKFSSFAVMRLRNFERYGALPVPELRYFQPSIDGETYPVPLFAVVRSMTNKEVVPNAAMTEMLWDVVTKGPYVVDKSAPKHLQSDQLMPDMLGSIDGKKDLMIGGLTYEQYFFDEKYIRMAQG